MKTPTAFEWHNYETGHAYVDYIQRANMTEKDGYTKIPLFADPDKDELREELAKIILWDKKRVIKGLNELFETQHPEPTIEDAYKLVNEYLKSKKP
jgi:hypothetical protein